MHAYKFTHAETQIAATQALKISTSQENAKLTSTIYALFIKSNTRVKPFQAASLITHFSHSGELSRATYLLRHTCGFKTNAVKLFDEMSDRDVVSWTGRIAVAFDCVDAFKIFKYFILNGYEINEYA
ncbi:unnamed protein product [Lactuca saligna]|uniref:Pentatricopeptide repeat-containing protein n=1 Tax=Lactuca saligna TaxID=75948 RepID=A0AA36DXP5_LACSI|nr:unnamed protein product [Lactuca saligna]